MGGYYIDNMSLLTSISRVHKSKRRRGGLTSVYALGPDLPHEVPLYRNHMYSGFLHLDPCEEQRKCKQ